MKRIADGTAGPSLTEPVIQDCKFITGGAFEISAGSVRWVAWVELPDLGGEMRERRIVARIAMTKRTAREMLELMADGLDEG